MAPASTEPNQATDKWHAAPAIGLHGLLSCLGEFPRTTAYGFGRSSRQTTGHEHQISDHLNSEPWAFNAPSDKIAPFANGIDSGG